MSWIKSLQKFFNKTFIFIWLLHKNASIALIVMLSVVLIVLRLTTFYLESNPQVIHSYIESELNHSISFDRLTVDINPLYPSISMNNVRIQELSADKDPLAENSIISLNSVKIKLDVIYSIIYQKVVLHELLLDGFNLLVQRVSQDEISIAGIKINIKQDEPDSSTFDKDSDLLKLLGQNRLIISHSRIMFEDKLQEYPTNLFTDIYFSIRTKGIKHQIELQMQLNKINTQLDLRFDLIGSLEQPERLSGQVYGFIDKLTHRTIESFIKEDVLQIDNYHLDHLNAGIKVWAKIKNGKFHSAQGQLVVNESELMHVDDKQSINIYDLKSNFKLGIELDDKSLSAEEDFNLLQKNWFFDLYDLNFSVEEENFTGQRLYINNTNNELGYMSEIKFFINKLELQQLTPFTSFFLSKGEISETLHAIKPQGKVENIVSSITILNNKVPDTHVQILDVDANKIIQKVISNFQIQADLNDISLNAYNSIPKITRLSAQIIFNKEQGNISIDSSNMDLHLADLFRDSWLVDLLSGEVYWQKDEQDWLLGLNNLKFSNPHLSIDADLKLWFIGDRFLEYELSESGLPENKNIFMDLTAFFSVDDVSNVPLYLPSKVMSDGLVNWLDNAFDSGAATDGGVVFRGQLDQFPFSDHSGVLDISFNAEDVLLEYQKDWPKLKNIDAFIQFTEKGMLVESYHSEVFSAVSNNINAEIKDYLKPVLNINGDIQASIADALKYLQQSSLVSKEIIEMLDAEGEINLNMDLKIPTKEGEPDTKVLVSFKDADYYPPGFVRKKGIVSHVKGSIMVHNERIDGKNITASIMHSPAQLEIKTATRLTRKNKEPNISVMVNSKISLGQLEEFSVLPKKYNALKQYISGSSRLFSEISLPNEEQPFAVTFKTDLKGFSSDLPQPFKKNKDEKIILKGRYAEFSGQAGKQPLLNIDYADNISLVLLLNNKANEMGLTKGHIAFAQGKAALPKQKVLKISGRVPEFPFDEWGTVLESFETKKIKSKALRKKNILAIELAITELILPEPDFLKKQENLPLSSSQLKEPDTLSNMEPGDFPLLRGTIQSLNLGGIELGKLTIESSRVDGDILFDVLHLEGEFMSFQGNANWHHWYDIPEVNVEGTISSPSLGKLMKKLHFDEVISGGKAEVSGFIKWQGAPDDFSIKNIKGNIHIDIKKGSFVDAKPGAAGRLLGLINLNEFTRRISLDFSDVKDKGFAFDTISGDLKFLNGNLYTENLRIFAPSSNMLITGHTGFVTKYFDQRILVIPEISATLPIAGAVVAGPAGAAIAWIGQKLVGNEINKISAFYYTVKGSWDNPEIVRDKSGKPSSDDIKNLLNIEKKQINTKVENPLLDIDN